MSYSETMLDQLSGGQLDDAKKSFALALRNDDDDTLYSLAEELYGLGFLNQSRRTYLKLLEKYPDEDQLRTALADIAIDEGESDEALSYLDQINEDSPAYLESLLVAADLYQTQELFEVSERKLLNAYEIAPDEPVVLFALAEFYYMMGQYEQAIPYYFDLIKSGETTFAQVDLAGRIGTAEAQRGHFEQALGYLEQVKPEFQTSDVKFQTGFTQLQLKQTKDAIETLENLREEDPQYATLYQPLAKAYQQDNDEEQALQTLKEGMGVDEYNENLYEYAAGVASHLDEEQLVGEYLLDAYQINPENLSIVLKYSNWLLKQNQYSANVELLKPIIEQDEVDPQMYWNLAISYQHTEKLELAGQYFEAAQPFFTDQPDFLRQATYYYREMGQFDQMLETLRKYVALVPDDAEMALMLEDYEI
ncbi:tetratricopeptide repeat protein [Paucilactobacillus nenjiangensis]|uniref:Tetratricopeptide repeat protein n=1 Tax=Paucilactobacillus nenjiangensis TaxID=1296540 RepID=A0A5P1X209_9LACO|nr:tetratricopeptide repeat protein [Paucilactobacillus nenjiangensis]QER67445.1 tetratricopeptide repeat protein [Paucilactobacillus nenjiangensis]